LNQIAVKTRPEKRNAYKQNINSILFHLRLNCVNC